MTPSPSQLRKAYAATILSVLTSVASPIIYRYAQAEGVASLAIIVVRLGLSALILTPGVWRGYRDELRGLRWHELMLALAAGLFMTCSFIGVLFSLQNTSVLMAAVLINTSPIVVALLEVFFLKAQLGVKVWVGLALVIGGGMFIALLTHGDFAGGKHPLLGGLFAIEAAVTGAVYLVIGRKLRASLSTLPYIWLVYGCGALIASLIVIPTRTPLLGYSPMGYFWLLTVTIVPQLIGHSTINYALEHLPATLITIIGQVNTPLAAVAAFFLLGETPTGVQVIGSAIILLGVMITNLGRMPRRPQFLTMRYTIKDVASTD